MKRILFGGRRALAVVCEPSGTEGPAGRANGPMAREQTTRAPSANIARGLHEHGEYRLVRTEF